LKDNDSARKAYMITHNSEIFWFEKVLFLIYGKATKIIIPLVYSCDALKHIIIILGDFLEIFGSIFSNQKISKPEKAEKAVGNTRFFTHKLPKLHALSTEKSQFLEKVFPYKAVLDIL